MSWPCWISGHDWEVVYEIEDEVFPWHYADRVCLKCTRIERNATKYRKSLRRERNSRLSRKERAQAIFQEEMRRG